MPTIRFPGQNKKFQFNYSMLFAFAQHFPADEKYLDLANGLISLEISSITNEILKRGFPGRSKLDALWASGSARLRSQLLENERFFLALTDEQARDILASGDSRMFFTAARLIHLFWKPETPGDKRRLSPQMADALLRGIKNFHDPIIKKLIASECSRPASFIFPAEREPLNCKDRFEDLTEDDIKLLPYLPVTTVAALARDFDDVADAAVQSLLIGHLLDHDDPLVRLNLSKNDYLPYWVLDRLARDAEPDVADSARKSLAGEDE